MPLIDSKIVKRHPCGVDLVREYTYATWQALALVGVTEDAVNKLELRNCTCGSTITIVLEHKRWTLDDVEIEIDDFLIANRDTLTRDELHAIEHLPLSLPHHHEIHFGGGAMPLAILKRIL